MFVKLLRDNVKQGIIHLHMPEGKTYRFGKEGLEAHWLIKSEKVIHKIARDWEYELGETYINGGWDVAHGQIRNLLCILRANFSEYRISGWLQPFLKMVQQWNKVSRSYINVSRHYDLDEVFFRMFLDKEMHYSCAYFNGNEVSLEKAQQAKCRHIASKLLLRPGQRVLDIGCGWGSFAFYLAEHYDIDVTGLTLSRQQLKVAQRAAYERGLSHVDFKLQDYREHFGCYDRIVSIGMFEHVGQPNYASYFKKVQDMLKNDGVALIHSIGRTGPPNLTNPWIRKHIFPGGSVPSLSEVSREIEDVGFMMTDIEILRLHYAQTLRIWQQRFHAHKAEIRLTKGEKFYRTWDFYLTICEIAFQHSDLVVFQLQLAKQHGVVPTTRDYLYSDNANEQELQRLRLV